MTTAYTSLLGLALPVTGELSGTWGDTVNNYITGYLDAAVAGTNTFSTDADVTLVKTTNASLSGTSSQYAVLLWTAGGTVTRTIIAPAASSGSRQFYIVVNKTSSTQSIKLCGAGPTTGVTITAGTSALCAWNGSDFIQVTSPAVSSVATGTGLTGGPITSTGTIAIDSTVATLTGAQTLTNKTIQGGAITSGTAVASTSGTSVDFTSIPSWVKRITVMFNVVSTNGTSVVLVQIGAGSIDAATYNSIGFGSTGSAVATTQFTTGFGLTDDNSASYVISGSLTLSLLGSNIWTASGTFYNGSNQSAFAGGSKTLSGTLDRVRITTVNGTDTFDAGSINILYE